MRKALQAAARGAFAIGLLTFTGQAVATAEEDFRAGQLAYQRGDVAAAITALRRGAAANHAPSQYLLGFLLENAGLVDEAAGHYRRAAEQDHADALAAYAGLLAAGRGVPKDERAAFDLYSRAAERGHAMAIRIVADAYLKGELGARASDDGRALPALRRAAERDHLAAIDALATAYQRGDYGAAPDAAEAARWQARAADLRKRQTAGAAKK